MKATVAYEEREDRIKVLGESKEGGTVLGRPEDVPDDCKEARAERGAQNDGGWG